MRYCPVHRPAYTRALLLAFHHVLSHQAWPPDDAGMLAALREVTKARAIDVKKC